MGKNNTIIKVIVIGFVFVSIGMIIIQTTGGSYKDPFDNVAMSPDDFTQSGIQQNKNLIIHNKTLLDKKLLYKNDAVDDSTNSEILKFINKTLDRYPVLLNIGRKMGLTRQDVSDTAQQFGDDNTIKIYISLVSRMLGI